MKVYAILSSLFLLIGLQCHAEPVRQQKCLEKAITTIPKAGTGFFANLLKDLKIDVAVAHYFLDTDESLTYFGDTSALLRKPEDFVGKTVIVVRDLHDVMVSTVYWLDKVSLDILQNPPPLYNESDLVAIQQYLQSPFESKLLKIILMEDLCFAQMFATKMACELIVKLLKKPFGSFFVIKFENFIGIEAGGHLSDRERFLLLSEMFDFLGYKRTPSQVEIAVQRIFGKSHTYNPVQKKVGRWQEVFNEQHQKAFEKNWQFYNAALGYSP